MLDAGRAPQHIEGLTLFFDHAEERRRYVLCEIPTLVRDPDPRLSLMLFRGTDAATSGGLLQFEVRLAPAEAQLEAAARVLSQDGLPPLLVRPDWRSGSVSLAGWLQADELAPVRLAVGAPSLVGDPAAVIAARLDAAGAALAHDALKGNALPTVVIFELETLGLAGPLAVDAEADLQALHDRLTAQGGLNTPYGRARISATWEQAARENVIRVRVVDQSADVESDRAEAMRRLGEDLLARFFSPFPPPERPPQLRDEAVAPIELAFRLTMRREELETTARWSFRERRPRSIRHYAAASLIDLLGASPTSRHVLFADLVEPAPDALVRVEPELARLGIAAVEVELRESAGGDVEQTLVLTDTTPELRIVRRKPDATLQFRVRARFDPLRTSAPDRQTEWLDAIGSLVAVSPRRLFAPRTVSLIIGRAELDWIDHVEVVLSTPGEPPQSIVLDAGRQSADVFFPASGQSVTVVSHWRGRGDEPSRTVPARDVVDDIIVLDSPFADSINVLAVLLPRADIAAAVVDLRASHRDFADDKTVAWDTPDDRAPRRVGLRRLPGSARRYAYRVRLIGTDGTVEEKPWKETDTATLIIGADGPVTVRTVDVVLVGGGPEARGSFAIELTLESGGARHTVVLDGHRTDATLVVVVASASEPATLVAREFMTTGEVRETRWVDPEALTIIAP